MTRYHITWVAGLAIVLLLWQTDAYFQIKRNLTLFSEVYQEVSVRYVDEVDAGTLLRTGIDAMLTVLDPYTVLYDEGDDAVLDMLVSGSYTGVGIEVGARGQQLVIIAPIEGYSAHEKGVRAGDVIVAVDGVSVDGYSIEDLHSLLKGEVGTSVRMTLRRHGLDEPMFIDLIRSRVEVPNVSHATWLDEPQGLAYVVLSSFGAGAAEEVRAELARLQGSTPIRGLILDLRNNPGGLLDEAVKLVDLFVPAGELVVRTNGRAAETRDDYKTREPAFYSGALAVLQNNGSASSSEIVSGAIQDLDRGIVVGGRSFGKGLVQVVRPLSYNVALKLTVSRYYTPSGRSIQALQYRHDGTDATVLPDSLRAAFRTRNGRTVKDGMGIEPDLMVHEPESNRLDMQLRQGGHYFRFANEFRSKHDRYASVSLPDGVYLDFMAWLQQEGFEYQTRSMVHYAELKAQVPVADRSTDPDSWTRLDAHLRELRDREFDQSAALVRAQLHDELLTRYESSKATNDRRLRADAAVLEAGRLLTRRHAVSGGIGFETVIDMVADLHLHTRCSDGALAPADLVRLVASRGVHTFSITDHDTMDAYADASPLAAQLGLRLIPGVELSTRFGRHDLHLLVYGLDADEPGWASRLQQQKSIRYRRAKDILTALRAMGVAMTIDDVVAEAGHLNLGRHHIARVLVQAGYASGIQAAFDRWILPASASITVRFPDSLDLIAEVRRRGGVSILAHPGATFPYPDIKVLVDGGLAGIESAHPRHDERVKRKWTDYAQRVGILSTGGSDYHGHRSGEEANIGRYQGLHIPEVEVVCL